MLYTALAVVLLVVKEQWCGVACLSSGLFKRSSPFAHASLVASLPIHPAGNCNNVFCIMSSQYMERHNCQATSNLSLRSDRGRQASLPPNPGSHKSTRKKLQYLQHRKLPGYPLEVQASRRLQQLQTTCDWWTSRLLQEAAKYSSTIALGKAEKARAAVEAEAEAEGGLFYATPLLLLRYREEQPALARAMTHPNPHQPLLHRRPDVRVPPRTSNPHQCHRPRSMQRLQTPSLSKAGCLWRKWQLP